MTDADSPAPANAAEPLTPAAPPASPRQPNLATVFRRLGPAGPLAVASAALPAVCGFVLLASTGVVGAWLRSHQDAGMAIYIAGFALLSGAAVLPTYAQSVVGGWAFGFVYGFPAAMAGMFLGASLGYGLGRAAAGDRAVRLIAEQPRWQAVHDGLLGAGFWRTVGIIVLVRLNSPFAMVNFLFGAMRTKVVAHGLGTLVGLAPRTAASVYIGAGLQELTGKPSSPTWLIISSIVASLIAVSIIGMIANRAVERVTGAGGVE